MPRRLIADDVSLVLRLAEPLGSVKADLGKIEQILVYVWLCRRSCRPHAGAKFDLWPGFLLAFDGSRTSLRSGRVGRTKRFKDDGRHETRIERLMLEY